MENKENFEKAMTEIDELELEYGSLVYVPENNKKLQHVRELINGPYLRPDPSVGLSNELQDKIAYLLEYGCTSQQIMFKLHLDSHYIRDLRIKLGIKRRKIFHYQLKKEDYPSIYVPSIQSMQFLLSFGYRTWDGICKEANDKGFQVKQHDYLFGAIPNGNYYTTEGRVVYEKRGKTSYEQYAVEDFILF